MLKNCNFFSLFFSILFSFICFVGDWIKKKQKINFFNVEIGVFLRYLHYFSNIECVKIGEQTVELLQAIVNLIAELMNKAEIVKLSERTDVDFLIDLDEHRYELRRCILCRHCFVSKKFKKKTKNAIRKVFYFCMFI